MSDPAPRLELVQAIYDALITMNPAKIEALKAAGTYVTPAERDHAEQLYASSLMASQDHRIEAWRLLASHTRPTGATWEQVIGAIPPEQHAQLRDLYGVLPDGARAEYDRQFGYPEA